MAREGSGRSSPGAFVLVVGHAPGPDANALTTSDPWSIERDGGSASLLRTLGANVQTRTLWQTDPVEGVAAPGGAANASSASSVARSARASRPGSPTLRAVVLELGERPDLASGALRHLRSFVQIDNVPVIMVIGERQITRLDPSTGFDDFLVLPCRAEELYARIRALEWRRSEFASDERSKVGGVVVDRAAHEATVDGRAVTLTAKEFALLAFLAANRGRVFSRETLLARVWGSRYDGGARTVDIHVRRLRAKLGDALPLETSRGAGYKMRAPDSQGDGSDLASDGEGEPGDLDDENVAPDSEVEPREGSDPTLERSSP